MKAELDFSNYATKADLKNATCVDTAKFAKKFDYAWHPNCTKIRKEKMLVFTLILIK